MAAWIIITLFLGTAAAVTMRSMQRRVALQELSRLRIDPAPNAAASESDILSWLKERLQKGDLLDHLREKAEAEKMKRFLDAGLEVEEDRDRYLLVRGIFMVGGPVLGAITYLYLPPYYATIMTLICTAIGVLVPMMWLNAMISDRNEDIQRELPLLLDLTNLGTSAGWDLGTSLEKVVESLAKEFPDHPLIREFRRASWLTASGYTWEEALARVADRLGSDTVRRTTLALTQALRHGGERVTQLEAIAEDAQRSYYADLDKRLAGLPVKTLLVTMLLMIGYFVVLMAPTSIQIKNVIEKNSARKAAPVVEAAP